MSEYVPPLSEKTINPDEYVTRIEGLTNRELKAELDSIHSSLALVQQTIEIDASEIPASRQIIATLNQKTQLIVQLQQRRAYV